VWNFDDECVWIFDDCVCDDDDDERVRGFLMIVCVMMMMRESMWIFDD